MSGFKKYTTKELQELNMILVKCDCYFIGFDGNRLPSFIYKQVLFDNFSQAKDWYLDEITRKIEDFGVSFHLTFTSEDCIKFELYNLTTLKVVGEGSVERVYVD